MTAKCHKLAEEIPVELKVELGRKTIKVKDLMEMKEGSFLELEKEEGELLDIFVNGRFFGRGEAVVVDGKYGIRLVEIVEDGD